MCRFTIKCRTRNQGKTTGSEFETVLLGRDFFLERVNFRFVVRRRDVLFGVVVEISGRGDVFILDRHRYCGFFTGRAWFSRLLLIARDDAN